MLIILFAVAIGLYTIYQARHFLSGPELTLLSPQNGATVSDSLIEIKGHADNIVYISLNDRQIYVDQQGNFSENLLLFSGYNVITLKAKDKFGRETEKVLSLVYKPAG